jgi:hypothetical protein
MPKNLGNPYQQNYEKFRRRRGSEHHWGLPEDGKANAGLIEMLAR